MISAFEFPDFLKLMTNRRECLTAIKKKHSGGLLY